VRINDLCDPELTSSLVRQYVPNATLKGQKAGELCYSLPLENTDSFPGKKSLSLCQGCTGKPSGGKSRKQSCCEGNTFIPLSILHGMRKSRAA